MADIVASIAKALVLDMGDNVVDFFKGSTLKVLLERLSVQMRAAKAVLDDYQITDERGKRWLYRLREASYDAEDLLDEIAYNALGSELEAGSPEQVRELFLSRTVEQNLEAMIDELDGILDDVEFKETITKGENQSAGGMLTTSRPEDNASAIYGREADKDAMMSLLLSDDPSEDDVGLIRIVGMAGVGKTTFARFLYNDQRVRCHFELQAWVSLTRLYAVDKVMQVIIQRFTGDPCYISELSALQTTLTEFLTKKRFLLVLDDEGWNHDEDWRILLSPLRCGVRGSKIIVTTSNGALSNMCTGPVHHLKELTDEDCWSLFSRYAFDGVDFRAHPDLEEIGRAIAKKCKGLPLSAKILGKFLHTKRDALEWKNIMYTIARNLDVGANILQILKLSYNYLPPHVRHCLAYCSIFPKNYRFQKEELIHLWMAEGLLVQSEGKKHIEEVGEECFQQMVSRSFFEQSSINPSSFVKHDLATDVAADSYFHVDRVYSYGSAGEVRRFLYAEDDSRELFELIHRPESLRTFFIMKRSNWMRYNEVINKLLLKFRRLRVLSLSGCDGISQLHDSIGTLKHLRFLNISETSISKLPPCVCKLYYLQTLILYGCKHLTELPANLRNLINLSLLDIRETNLQWMPSAMGKLTKLRKLSDFVVGKQKGSSIKELGVLQRLQGELSVWNLQNVLDAQDAFVANLKEKHLNELKLKWDENTQDANLEEDVLKQLQPHVNVKHLLIAGYGAKRFPQWVGDSSFSNMVSLKLIGCKYCSFLPPLGQLKSLQELWITEFHGIVDVGAGFYGSSIGMKPFGSLKVLKFERLPLWRAWVSYTDEDNNEAFPLLQELYIRDCPSLLKALPRHLPCLTTLDIEGCQKLVVDVLPSAPSILKYILKDNSRLLQLQELPSGMRLLRVDQFFHLDFMLERKKQAIALSANLEAIHISRCHSLKFFPLEYFPNLRRFEVYGCPNLESLFVLEALLEDKKGNLSESLSNFPLLQELRIRECPKLTKALPSSLPSLTTLEIEGCQRLVVAFVPETSATLEAIHISGCHSLKFFPLEYFPKLRRFDVYGCPNLESLFVPEDDLSGSLLNFPLVQELRIRECPKLTKALPSSLPYLITLEIEGCQQLVVASVPEAPAIVRMLLRIDTCQMLLEKSTFEIRNWDSLKYFPLEMFPKLNTLQIISCPNLDSLCVSKAPLGDFLFLNCVEIWGCHNLESFPIGLAASNLKVLSLRCCSKLKSLPEPMPTLLPSLVDLQIVDCSELDLLPEGGWPSKLESLEIQSCKKLFACLTQWNFQSLTCLSRFVFGMCEDVESFPENMLLPPSLNSLEIGYCQI
ncbi:Disease resistance protein RPM1, putative [Ricinus communis]|uniref:Disease resistance protein RPM1, putative n=1 Tax=Ricinus communis TaxID=3988 RepID=B9RGE2_RICCO|nr:Disease resistance protein RPM1, putative [Ricinus communis]|eukprot:XP_025011990.1 putative disease resistance protein At3g14460 [Ricinus communis]